MIRTNIFDKVAGGSAHFLEHIDTDLEGFYRLEDRIKYLKVDFFSLSISWVFCSGGLGHARAAPDCREWRTWQRWVCDSRAGGEGLFIALNWYSKLGPCFRFWNHLKSISRRWELKLWSLMLPTTKRLCARSVTSSRLLNSFSRRPRFKSCSFPSYCIKAKALNFIAVLCRIK